MHKELAETSYTITISVQTRVEAWILFG